MKVFPCAYVGEVNRNRNYVKMKIVWKIKRNAQTCESYQKHTEQKYSSLSGIYNFFFFFCNTTHNLILFYAFKEHLFIR